MVWNSVPERYTAQDWFLQPRRQRSQDTPLAQMSSLDLFFEFDADFYSHEVPC